MSLASEVATEIVDMCIYNSGKVCCLVLVVDCESG